MTDDTDSTGTPLQPIGGGSNDGMEARVARLEADVEHIKRDIGDIKTDMRSLGHVGDIRVDLGVLRERVSHLPTKGYIGWFVVIGLAALAALVTVAPALQKFLGITASAQLGTRMQG
jgi:hypothetical protein